MSEKRSGKSSTPNEELLEEIRQLKDRLRKGGQDAARPGGQAADGGRTEGLAEGIVAALGRMIPSLGGLIETASQMPDFRRRLEAIDEEVHRRFKEQPLGRASSAFTGGAGRRRMGIPPSVRRGGSGRAASAGSGQGRADAFGKDAPRGKCRQARGPRVHINPQTPAQLAVDVFDEGNKIVILADAPGLAARDVAVTLEGTVLLISVQTPKRSGIQRVELPCEVEGPPEVSLSNGILNIQMRKARKP